MSVAFLRQPGWRWSITGSGMLVGLSGHSGTGRINLSCHYTVLDTQDPHFAKIWSWNWFCARFLHLMFAAAQICPFSKVLLRFVRFSGLTSLSWDVAPQKTHESKPCLQIQVYNTSLPEKASSFEFGKPACNSFVFDAHTFLIWWLHTFFIWWFHLI